MKAALINTENNIVEGLIIVNSTDDIVPENYKLVEVEYYLDFVSEEEKSLYSILIEIDPGFYDTVKAERPIYPGITKWDESKGFYED
jgi:hypothetical protein